MVKSCQVVQENQKLFSRVHGQKLSSSSEKHKGFVVWFMVKRCQVVQETNSCLVWFMAQSCEVVQEDQKFVSRVHGQKL